MQSLTMWLLSPPPPHHQPPCSQTDADATPWEVMFPGSGPSSDLVVPAGRRVLLQGCRQPQSTVSVRTIRVEPGATVRGEGALGRVGSPSCASVPWK
jgi:hypothetical protein